MTGCSGAEKEIRSARCSRRKIKLNTDEWRLECVCAKMRERQIEVGGAKMQCRSFWQMERKKKDDEPS